MNDSELGSLLASRAWRGVAGATDCQIEELLAALPFTPPSCYIALLRASNGGEGELALAPMWFQLDDVDSVVSLWQDETARITLACSSSVATLGLSRSPLT